VHGSNAKPTTVREIFIGFGMLNVSSLSPHPEWEGEVIIKDNCNTSVFKPVIQPTEEHKHALVYFHAGGIVVCYFAASGG
jgi:hypothetical protein